MWDCDKEIATMFKKISHFVLNFFYISHSVVMDSELVNGIAL